MTQTAPETKRVEQFFENLKRRLRPLQSMISWLILAFLIVELTSFATLYLHAAADAAQGSPDDPRQHSAVYTDVDWAQAYFEEFAASHRTGYRSYTGYRRLPFSGRYINIDADGLRRTTPDCGSGHADALRVFFLGGSAAWGTGARDEGTIASRLAKELCDLGIPATVTNFGESGYTNTQELIQLQLELRDGHIPDLVIFYDGINDVYSTYQNRAVGLPQNVANRKRAHELSQKPAAILRLVQIALLTNTGQLAKKILSRLTQQRAAAESPEPPDPSSLDRETVQIILNNMRIIRTLEREYGFRSFLFWQPAVYNKNVDSEDEKKEIKQNLAYGEMYLRVAELIKHEESIIDLSDIFDEYSRTFFIDEFHISEEGNWIVADAVFESLLPYLRSTGRWPRGDG